MLNTPEEIDALIVRYLNGEAGPEEAIQLEDWKNENTQNLEHFIALEKTHAHSYGTPQFTATSKGTAWKVIEHEIGTETKIVPLWKRPLFIAAVSAAAIVALVLVTQIFSTKSTPKMAEDPKINVDKTPDSESLIYASTQVAYYTLKDDSKVTLQPGSKLTVPADFNKRNRSLSLEGSGSFEVIHDEANPFVLNVGELEIFDLGTIFHVDHIGDTIKVSVDEGIVELKIKGQKMVLEEGDSAFYLVSQKVIKEYSTHAAREDVVFAFDGTTLEEVTRVLSAFFKREIVIKNPALSQCTVSVTFKNEGLPTILDIISELMDITIIQNQKTIEIHGESCQ